MVTRQGISHWFLDNPTAANLLMWVLIASGIVAIFTMRQEVFPTMVIDTIEIRAEYRGATASEVESEVVQPMEQSINTLLDIKTVVSEVRAGGANIFVMLDSGADTQRTLAEIRSSISGISSLPSDLDPPIITQVRDGGGEMDIGFYGFSSREELFDFSEQVRARLLALPTVGQVEVEGAGEPEVAIRVSPHHMRLFGVSLSQVAARIRRATFELSGGAFRSSIGEYGLATGSDRRFAAEFGDIAIVESTSGAPLTLTQIANIEDSFRPDGVRFNINGSPGFLMTVYGAGQSTPQDISSTVRAEIELIESEMFAGGVVIFDDDAKSYADRAGILVESAMIGLVLVLILLFLVLEPRVALWVAIGLPVAMFGGVAVFALTPYTINFVSIFAFVIVIGVVVDDAVVVGESVFSGIQEGKSSLEAARDTLDRFGGAITLAIVTNIVAFVPILFMPGELGLFLLAIPVVTTCVFLVSLIEALWILPSHLAYSKLGTMSAEKPRRIQMLFERARDKYFMPCIQFALSNRAVIIFVGLTISAAIFSWILSGRIPIALQPQFESQEVHATYALTPGASQQQVDEMARNIETLGLKALSTFGGRDDIDGVRAQVGAPASHKGRVSFTLVEPELRSFSATEFATRWQEEIGQPAELTELAMDYVNGPGGGRDLTLEIAHASPAVSRAAAEELVRELKKIAGVEQISYSGNSFRSEVRFELTPTGRALGFDESEVSSQIRAQLDGLEATRLTRGVNEVRVMIRGRQSNQRTLPDLSGLILISNSGQHAVLGDLATIHWHRGAVQLRRINGQRVERVEASINSSSVSKALVEDLVSDTLLPGIEARYPGLITWDEAIDTGEDAETAQNLLLATIGMLVSIFILVSAYTRSSLRGAVLLSALPICAAGAFLGHFVLGVDLSAASFMGVLALSGLVINACLLLHLRYMEGIHANQSSETSMLNAVHDRFRPIVLSSITTLLGLTPLIFSNSIHAAPLQPVAISVGFGMVFSIPVILILLPCIVVSLEQNSEKSRQETALSQSVMPVSR